MSTHDLNISKIELRDYNSIVSISNKCFGDGFINIHKLNTLSFKECIQIKAVIGGEIIGFCQVIVDNNEQLNQKYKGISFVESKGYILQTLAIHPRYQRLGYGSRLVDYLLQKLSNSNPNTLLLYPSWNEPKSQAFCNSLVKLGFKELKTYKNFWFNDSIQNNYVCLVCSKPPCTCSMQLMKLK